MSNKNKKLGLGIAAVAAAGAGLVYAAQKTSQQKVKKIAKAAPPVDYRNTERGKYEKTAKAFITPTETTKPSQDRKNRKASMRRAHTS